MHPDLELLRLERTLHEARDRLALVTRLVPDAAVLRAAAVLYAEAIAAVDVHNSSGTTEELASVTTVI